MVGAACRILHGSAWTRYSCQMGARLPAPREPRRLAVLLALVAGLPSWDACVAELNSDLQGYAASRRCETRPARRLGSEFCNLLDLNESCNTLLIT